MFKAEAGETPKKRKSIAIESAVKSRGESFTPKKQNQSSGNKQQASGQESHKNTKSGRLKKNRRGHMGNLVAEVSSKEGSKDATTLKKLNEMIDGITSRGELSRTAKRKLRALRKLKLVCEEGPIAASKSRAKVEQEKIAAVKAKAGKKSVTVQTEQPKNKQVAKAAPLNSKEEKDEDEESDAEESAEVEQGESDDEAKDEKSDKVTGEKNQDSDKVQEEDGDDNSGEEVSAPMV